MGRRSRQIALLGFAVKQVERRLMRLRAQALQDQERKSGQGVRLRLRLKPPAQVFSAASDKASEEKAQEPPLKRRRMSADLTGPCREERGRSQEWKPCTAAIWQAMVASNGCPKDYQGQRFLLRRLAGKWVVELVPNYC